MDKTFVMSSSAVRWCSSLATLATFAAYLYLGAQPVAFGLLATPYDKFAHFLLYGGISALACIATGCRFRLWIFIAVTLLAMGDEWWQSFLPGRMADPFDVAADVAAAVIVVVLAPKLAGCSGQSTRFFNYKE